MKKYSIWDYRLIKGLYNYDSYEVDGYPAHIQDSPDVSFVADKKIIRSQAAVERRENAYMKSLKDRDREPGLRFYPKMVLADGAKFPSRKAWLEGLRARESGDSDAQKREKIRLSRIESEERGKDMVSNLNDELKAELERDLGITLG